MIKKVDLSKQERVSSLPNPYSTPSHQHSEGAHPSMPNYHSTGLTTQATSILLKSFQGPSRAYKSIKSTPKSDHIFLNYRNDSIKILIDFDHSGYTSMIPIVMKKRKVVDFEPYESDKLITLTKDNILEVFRFQTFGHHEKIAQYAQFPKEHCLCEMQLCPREKFMTLVQMSAGGNSLSLVSHKIFKSVIIMALGKKSESKQKKSTKSYKISFSKVYEIPFNFDCTEYVFTSIPFYWKGKPVLSIFEREMKKLSTGYHNRRSSIPKDEYVRSRLYFYTFGVDKFTIVKDLLFPRVKKVAGFGYGFDCLVQVGVDGEILKVGPEEVD